MYRLSKALVVCGALLIWYAIIGFLVAPSLVRHFGERELRANFSAESTIEKVRINPFSGSFRIEGLYTADVAGAWSVAWQEAELNASALTFVKFYPVVDELRLSGADIRYEKRPGEAGIQDESVSEGSEDWVDLVNKLNVVGIPELQVDLLEVLSGRFEFVDRTRANLYEKTVDPINLTLRDVTTVIDGDSTMRLLAETPDGAVFSWEGDFKSRPIHSSGTLTLSGLAIHDLSPYYTQLIRFNLKRAVFGLGFDYTLDLSNMDSLFQLQNGQLRLTEVLCEPIDQDDQLISVDSVTVDGIDFKFPAMALEVADVQIATGETRIFRSADGQINLAHLIALPSVAEVTPEPEQAASQKNSLPALSYRIAQIGLSDYRIVWEEALEAGLANLTVDIPSMTITGLSSELESPFQLVADYQIGDSGTAHIKGDVTAAGPMFDLSMAMNAVPLQLLSPYAQNFGKTAISNGTLDFEGRFQFAAEGAQTLTGAGTIKDIAFIYNGALEAQWSALNLEGLQLDLAPFGLAMEAVSLVQPEVVFTSKPAAPATQREPEPDQKPESRTTESDNHTVPIRIDSLSISEGLVTYVDERMEPAVRIAMEALNLSLNGLDMAASQPADVALSTRLNGSELKIDGVINTSQMKEATRLKASLSGLSLPEFSAYSGQVVGRRIASGRFDLDSDWVIEANQLDASNQIRIEQLKFGDTVESESAVSLPLDLAVTLLKGSNGVMDLSLPLSGDLSDPDVGIGEIVGAAIFGLITNVAAAPFKLLSNLVDTEEDLSTVNFDPGTSGLDPAMVERLNALSTALKKRPGLTLVITPQISKADAMQLAEAKLRSDLLGDSDPGDEKLYRQRLTKRYRDTMETAGTPDTETDADDERGLKQMVAALLPGVELSDADRASLAAARTAAIREHLMAAQGIAASRLSVDDPEVGASESGARFDLK